MEFRRSGLGDERRRRVLIDAPKEDGEKAEPAPARRASSRRYSEAALTDRQPRVTDLAPRRVFTLAVLALAGITCVAAVEAAHIHLATHGQLKPGHGWQALDLTARGNMAGWLSSVWLAAGAGLSLVVFSIRRHKVDDYGGRYRVWLAAAAALGWASLDAGADVRTAVSLLVGQVAGSTGLARAEHLWILGYAIVFGALVLRMTAEMWSSLPALTLLGLAMVGYGASLATGARPADQASLERLVLSSSVLLLAHLTLVLAVAAYARHTCRDALGLVTAAGKARRTRRKGKTKAESSPASEEDAPNVSAGEGRPQASISKATLQSDDEEAEDDDASASGSKLSKAERKRLKRQQMQPLPQSTRRAA